MNQSPQKALEEYYGYESFRPKQKKIIDSVLENNDTLVLMPTGGGKSLCFQIPAIIQPGICIVVSPLISLMRDQVDSLTEKGVKAAFLNSTNSNQEEEDIKQEILNDDLDLLYVSPERLTSKRFLNFLNQVENINLFAIDEAHCISSWGHDFRPEYTRLKLLKDNFSDTPIIALTATADKNTRRDIVYQLGIDFSSVNTFVSSFDRPNINLKVLPAENRISKISKFIKNKPKEPGVIYCLSRKTTEILANKLKAQNIDAKAYHAGIENSERDKRQKDFIYDNTNIICATIAFGMGIDKSNIRWVIHYNLPKNIEGYYQQIGRAGRDGAESKAILFYKPSDFGKLRNFAEDSNQEELQMSKLKHMRKYAENNVCRRKSLLGYFGEKYQKKVCDNCDVCKQKEDNFEATEIAQKALSVVARVDDKIESGLLIDILRGSEKSRVVLNDYDKIKTYGAGEDISRKDWEKYIDQMLSLYLIRFCYRNRDKITLTKLGKQVLEGEYKVRFNSSDLDLKAGDISSSEKLREEETLYSVLRKLRRSISQERQVAPYIVFNDVTLEEMAESKPIVKQELNDISGIGKKKKKRYGEQIIRTIRNYLVENGKEVSDKKKVFIYYQQDKTVKNIAENLDLSETEVYQFFSELYQEGYNINVSDFIAKRELNKIFDFIEEEGVPEDLNQINEHLSKDIKLEKIALTLEHYKRKNNKSSVVYY